MVVHLATKRNNTNFLSLFINPQPNTFFFSNNKNKHETKLEEVSTFPSINNQYMGKMDLFSIYFNYFIEEKLTASTLMS